MDSQQIPNTEGDKKTVMVCDDEVDILNIYASFLKRKFNVITAESGEACISTYKNYLREGKKVDALLVDYRLGDMLGDAVACQIKDLDGTKTLLITAYEIDEKAIADMKARKCIVGQLRKPISLMTLMEEIAKLIEQS